MTMTNDYSRWRTTDIVFNVSEYLNIFLNWGNISWELKNTTVSILIHAEHNDYHDTQDLVLIFYSRIWDSIKFYFVSRQK